MSVNAEIKTQEISYQGDGITMQGYLAWDDAQQGERPGVLVVHEWWGHNDNTRRRARMLAEEGYVALAVDMYGDGKLAEHPDTAGQFSGEVMSNLDGARARFEAAMDALKQQPNVDTDKIAAIGYCFGGAVVLQMARLGVDIDGVASFHGLLKTETPAQEGQVKASVLVAHGAADAMVGPDQVGAFAEEMTAAQVDYTLISYPNALHSFTNPQADANAKKFNLPVGYQEEADQRSWRALMTFFDRIFQ